jgi:predicted PurR-regulated permease PerM
MAVARKSARSRLRNDNLADTQFERILDNGSRAATVFIGIVVLLIVLKVGQVVLAPVSLALVVGLMFGPAADWFERRNIPPSLSALLVVLLLLVVIAAALLLFAVPLSNWIGKVPEMWTKLKSELASLKGPLDSAAALQNQIATIFGDTNAMTVRFADTGGTITGIAMIAPAIGAQVLLFLASLYFFVATRQHIRVSVLSLCVSRAMRWRTAHVFSDVEEKVSRFLLSVTVINVGVGVAVSLGMWALGVPSPLLWGALAAVTNYVPYVGQAVMIVILASVGLGTQSDLTGILAPTACYLFITFIEGQIITPQVLGRTMTLNPFLIFLSITLWLWAWGPVGGLVAVPSLLIVQSLLSHVLPGKEVAPRKRVRRTARMTDRDVVLANAAQVIKEKAADEAKATVADERRAEDDFLPPKTEGAKPRRGSAQATAAS